MKTPAKYCSPKDLTIQDVALDVTEYAIPAIKGPLMFFCLLKETASSIVDEDFANCLVGVDALLEEQ